MTPNEIRAEMVLYRVMREMVRRVDLDDDEFVQAHEDRSDEE